MKYFKSTLMLFMIVTLSYSVLSSCSKVQEIIEDEAITNLSGTTWSATDSFGYDYKDENTGMTIPVEVNTTLTLSFTSDSDFNLVRDTELIALGMTETDSELIVGTYVFVYPALILTAEGEVIEINMENNKFVLSSEMFDIPIELEEPLEFEFTKQ